MTDTLSASNQAGLESVTRAPLIKKSNEPATSSKSTTSTESFGEVASAPSRQPPPAAAVPGRSLANSLNKNTETPEVVDLEDYDDEEAPDAEEQAQDELARKKLANEGLAGATEQRGMEAPPVPDQVRKIWRMGYPLVRQWWNSGKMPDSHQATFNTMNKKIWNIYGNPSIKSFEESWRLTERAKSMTKNKTTKEDDKEVVKDKEALRQTYLNQGNKEANKYQFPVREISDQIQAMIIFRNDILRFNNLEAPNAKQQKEKKQVTLKLIQGAELFWDKLERKQIDPKLIVPLHIKEQFEAFVSASPELISAQSNFLAALTNPTIEQEQIWQDVTPKLHQLFEMVKKDMFEEDELQEMTDIVEIVTKKNEELVLTNKEMSLEPSDYSMPIKDLGLLVQYKSQGTDKTAETEKLMKKLKVLFAINNHKGIAELILPGKSIAPSPNTINTHRQKLLRAVIEDTQATPNVREQSNPESVQPKVSTEASDPLLEERSSKKPDTPVTIDDDDGTISMHSYDNGTTEYGKVVATRACKTDNPSMSRFFLNAGTENKPFYRVVRGSDLGPGANGLHDKKELHVHFNLTERKRHMRSTGKNTIKSVGPCVEMPRDKLSSKLTTKSKLRRPDLYFRVEYHAGTTENPSANTLPDVEWLTRTEFGQLVGRKFAEEKEKVMLPKQKTRKEAFEDYRQRNIDPDTGNSLLATDRTERPWLFTNGERMYNMKQDEEETQEDD